ncbi:YcaO-like family protein [Nitrospira sp. Nam80]
MKDYKTSFERLFQAAEYLVDSHVGIIHNVDEAPRQAGEPDFFYFYASSCDTSAFAVQRNSNIGGGGSTNRERAFAKAVGEAVERYCSAIFDQNDFPLTTFKSAPFLCVPPSEFALYSAEQCAWTDFPFCRFQHDTPVRWAPATEVSSGRTWHVPAAMVYVPYYYSHGTEKPIVQPISTGLACHMSYSEAAISAICEVIERDAFTITWQAIWPRSQIRLDSLSEENTDIVDRLRKTGSTVIILDISMDVGVPTILSVLRSDSPEIPALIFAASAHPDPEQAVRKSLEEVAYTSIYARHVKATLPDLSNDPEYRNIVDQESHVRFYSEHINSHLADFMFLSDRRIDFHEIPNISSGDAGKDVGALVEKIHSIGHKVLIADLTTPDVGILGFRVLRAIVPGFHPLVLGHRLRALGGTRLWNVPQKMGHRGIERVSGDNPAPHPYP